MNPERLLRDIPGKSVQWRRRRDGIHGLALGGRKLSKTKLPSNRIVGMALPPSHDVFPLALLLAGFGRAHVLSIAKPRVNPEPPAADRTWSRSLHQAVIPRP